MPGYRTQVELPATNGNPLDTVVNTFHFIADDLTALALAETQLTTFYSAIDAYLGSVQGGGAYRIRSYDLADPEPRAPVIDHNIAALTVASGSLPPEVAICVSYQAPRQSGVPQARRRGRFYVGPMSNGNLVSATGLPLASFLTALGAAVQNLLDASQAATTWAWAVYSRTNELMIEVNDCWIDNAWDIQRRRGTTATTRSTFT